jgi:hypothetical protein
MGCWYFIAPIIVLLTGHYSTPQKAVKRSGVNPRFGVFHNDKKRYPVLISEIKLNPVNSFYSFAD